MDATGSKDCFPTLAHKALVSEKRSNARWREIAARGLLVGLVVTAAALWIMMVL